MASRRLTGPDIEQFRDLLKDAFARPRFDELLLYRLNRCVEDYVGPTDDYRTALRKVISDANGGLWC